MAFTPGDIWIADDVVAHVENGAVTLQIGRPDRALPLKLANDVADKVWYASQMRELEVARKQGQTKTIRLTDRSRRSSLRLGGGFMITQGTRLLVARRTFTAPRRPGQFCESGGLFEVFNSDRDDTGNDFIASLLKESLEIVIKKRNSDRIYVPQLSAITKTLTPDRPELNIFFQPPDRSVEDYNEVIRKALDEECTKARFPGYDHDDRPRFYMKILDYDRSVKLQYGYSPEISVEITPEVSMSSLECVGVLSFPEDIDLAAVTYLEAVRASSRDDKLCKRDLSLLETLNRELGSREDIAPPPVCREDIAPPPVSREDIAPPVEDHQLWDTECFTGKLKAIDMEVKRRQPGYRDLTEQDMTQYEPADSPTDPTEWYFPLDREIHMIDFMSRDDDVWKVDSGFMNWGQPTDRTRDVEPSTLGKELSRVRLKATGGNYATEKLALAIKMHCGVPPLVPLVTP